MPRTEFDRIFERVSTAEPVDTDYVLGLWHQDRATWRGYWTEARVLGASWTRSRNRDVSKFLIIARARSGTTLLTQLLNDHPDVTCDGEVLAKKVLLPRRYLMRLAEKAPTRAYGAKLLSYQMVQVQAFRDPKAFLARLVNDGFRLIHLRRDTFAQTVSLAHAQRSKVFHSTKSQSKPERKMLEIDPGDFLRRLEWSAMLLEFETECLRGLPHLTLDYETGLSTPEQQVLTASRVFDLLGVPSFEAKASLKKLLPEDPRTTIENYAEIEKAATTAGLRHLLPD